MDIAIDAPHPLNREIDIKGLLAKIFHIKKNVVKNVEETLVCNLKQSKKIYKELLKNIINAIHDKADESDNNGGEPEFNLTKDGRRVCFGFDDDIIKSTLMKYEFFKSGNELDKSKIEKWIKSIKKENLHHKPYLEFDDEMGKIVIKEKMKLGNGEYIEVPAGRRYILN